jgi:hypothetical protein
MIFTKKNNDAILPTSSTDCFDKRCVSLYVNKTITLHPLHVTEIDFDLMVNIPRGYILRIVNHPNINPWGVLTTSIYNNMDNNEIELKLSVLSSLKHTLKPNDILCHLQLLDVNEFFFVLKCKYKLI